MRIYSGAPAGTSLTKVDQACEIQWQLTWNDMDLDGWQDMYVGDEYVYLIKKETSQQSVNVIIGKISYEGEVVDEISTNLNEVDIIIDFAIDSTGSIILATYYGLNDDRAFLRKFDTEGHLQSGIPLYDYEYGYIQSIQLDGQDNVYCCTNSAIVKFSSTFTFQWIKELIQPTMFVLEEGGCIMSRTVSKVLNVTFIGEAGNTRWSFKMPCNYGSSWKEYAYISDIAEGPNGLLYLLFTTYNLHLSDTIIVMNRDGNQILNYTVSFCNHLFTSIDVTHYRRIHITYNKLMFLIGRILSEDWTYENVAGVYSVEERIFGITLPTIMSSAGAFTIVIGVIAVLQKKRTSFRVVET